MEVARARSAGFEWNRRRRVRMLPVTAGAKGRGACGWIPWAASEYPPETPADRLVVVVRVL